MREMWFCMGLRGGSLGDLSPWILTGRMEKTGIARMEIRSFVLSLRVVNG